MALFGGGKEKPEEEEEAALASENSSVSLQDIFEKLVAIEKQGMDDKADREKMSKTLDDLLSAEEAEVVEEEVKKEIPVDETEELPSDEKAAEMAPLEEEEENDVLTQILESEPGFQDAYMAEGAKEKLNNLDEEEKKHLSELLETDPAAAAKFMMQIIQEQEEQDKDLQEIPSAMGNSPGGGGINDERKQELYRQFGS